MTPEVQAAVERVKQAVEAWDRYQPGITPRDVIEQALDMRGAIPDLLTALSEANERASILQTALHERTAERDEARKSLAASEARRVELEGAEGWLTLDQAPLDKFGSVWSPTLPDRLDFQGWVYAHEDGLLEVSAATAQGMSFTHWAPLRAAPSYHNPHPESGEACPAHGFAPDPCCDACPSPPPPKGEALPVVSEDWEPPAWTHGLVPARPSPGVSREEVEVTDDMVKRASIAFDEYVATIPPNDEVDTEPCVRVALEAALLSRGEG